MDEQVTPSSEMYFVGDSDELFEELNGILRKGQMALKRVKDPAALTGPDQRPAVVLFEMRGHENLTGMLRKTGESLPLMVPILAAGAPEPDEDQAKAYHDFVERPFVPRRVLTTLGNAQRLATTVGSRDVLAGRLRVFHNHWQKLNDIGSALTTIHELDQLLDFILKKCREITGADSGSLYLKEQPLDEKGQPTETPILRFKVAQNDSKFIPFKEWTMPARKESISGYVALEGKEVLLDDVYELPPGLPFRFDTSFDKTSGYRTGSMLVVPMRNHRGQIIGVIQLINKKRNPDDLLKDPVRDRDKVVSFDQNDRMLAVTLASQAAVAIDNARLMVDIRVAMRELKIANDELEKSHNKIEFLFDKFVNTCAKAVEARDNALSGHVERMAIYACTVGEAINKLKDGPLSKYKFEGQKMKALKYAAILHDFGKIGVREDILWKATRLKPDRMEAVRYRFQSFTDKLREEASRRQMRYLLENPGLSIVEYSQRVESTLSDKIQEIEDALEFVERVNRLGFLSDEDLTELNRIRETRLSFDGQETPLITDYEYENLAVRKGNLTAKEWVEMKKHVQMTHDILLEIPWEGDLKLVPEWAGSHHEKRDGQGYHRGLAGDDIPIGGQILAIVDIFEALTASDRPYKKQFTREEALDFLRESAAGNWLNPHIVELFIKERLYEVELPEWAKIPQRSTIAA